MNIKRRDKRHIGKRVQVTKTQSKLFGRKGTIVGFAAISLWEICTCRFASTVIT